MKVVAVILLVGVLSLNLGGCSSLGAKAAGGDYQGVVQAVESGADKESITKALVSYTHGIYIHELDLRMVQYLIEHGADVMYDEGQAVCGASRLTARGKVNIAVLDYVLKHGADLNQTKCLISSGRRDYIIFSWVNMARHVTNHNNPAEIRFTKSELLRMLEMFVENGLDMNIRNWDGKTPLEVARNSKVGAFGMHTAPIPEDIIYAVEHAPRLLAEKIRDFDTALRLNTIPTHEYFINQYPNDFSGRLVKIKQNLDILYKQRHDFQYKTAKSTHKADDYHEFLVTNPNSPQRGEIIQDMCKVLNNSRNKISLFLKYMGEGNYVYHCMSTDDRLMIAGPPGMRVFDLIRLRKSGMSDALIAARVRTSKEKYGEFDLSEMSDLKRLGLSDAIIVAMVESTEKYLKAKEEARKERERQEREREAAEQAQREQEEAKRRALAEERHREKESNSFNWGQFAAGMATQIPKEYQRIQQQNRDIERAVTSNLNSSKSGSSYDNSVNSNRYQSSSNSNSYSNSISSSSTNNGPCAASGRAPINDMIYWTGSSLQCASTGSPRYVGYNGYWLGLSCGSGQTPSKAFRSCTASEQKAARQYAISNYVPNREADRNHWGIGPNE